MPDLDAMIRYWLDLLGVTQANGWRVSWGWVDQIPHPEGGDAVGLNTCNGEAQTAHIDVRRPQSDAERKDLDDTLAHEVVHCLGARMQALLDAGREVDAHEYLAETLAPAMVRIKGTPKAKYLAKAARQLPARAKGKSMIDPQELAALAMKAGELKAMEGLPPEALALFEQLIAAAAGGSAGPASVAPPPLAADPPKPPEEKPAAKPPEADPTAMGMSEEERLAKDPMYKKAMGSAVEAILDGRSDLTAEQKSFAKTLGTPDKARAYLKTVGRVEQKPEGERLGLPVAPRGGAGSGSHVAPSGDKATNRLFRIMPGSKPIELGGEGVTLHDPKSDGKLLSLSVVDAFNQIREATTANTAKDRARMTGGAA
jgi:hypothetical protein